MMESVAFRKESTGPPAMAIPPSTDKTNPGASMGTQHDLNRRLYVLAHPGERVTPELLSAYANLLYFAANVTGVSVEQLRLLHLVRWPQRPGKD